MSIENQVMQPMVRTVRIASTLTGGALQISTSATTMGELMAEAGNDIQTLMPAGGSSVVARGAEEGWVNSEDSIIPFDTNDIATLYITPAKTSSGINFNMEVAKIKARNTIELAKELKLLADGMVDRISPAVVAAIAREDFEAQQLADKLVADDLNAMQSLEGNISANEVLSTKLEPIVLGAETKDSLIGQLVTSVTESVSSLNLKEAKRIVAKVEVGKTSEK